jgi:hypothetical protein
VLRGRDARLENVPAGNDKERRAAVKCDALMSLLSGFINWIRTLGEQSVKIDAPFS